MTYKCRKTSIENKANIGYNIIRFIYINGESSSELTMLYYVGISKKKKKNKNNNKTIDCLLSKAEYQLYQFFSLIDMLILFSIV